MKFIIYVIYNKAREKYYVGSTWKNWYKHRKYNHFNSLSKGTHHSPKLQNSYNKHGKDVFTMFIIEEGEGTKEFRWDRENYWISFFNSYKNGYNSTLKCNGLGREFSDEEKLKMSVRMKEDFKSGKRKPPNPKGQKRDPTLMSSINKLKKVPIEQYSIQGEFIKEWASTVDASKELNISRSAISNTLSNLSKSAGGFLWKKKNLDISIKRLNRKIEKYAVLQFDQFGNYIQEFESMTKAAIRVNSYVSGIVAACKNSGSSKCKGFYWRKKKEFDDYKIIINNKNCEDIV